MRELCQQIFPGELVVLYGDDANLHQSRQRHLGCLRRLESAVPHLGGGQLLVVV